MMAEMLHKLWQLAFASAAMLEMTGMLNNLFTCTLPLWRTVFCVLNFLFAFAVGLQFLGKQKDRGTGRLLTLQRRILRLFLKILRVISTGELVFHDFVWMWIAFLQREYSNYDDEDETTLTLPKRAEAEEEKWKTFCFAMELRTWLDAACAETLSGDLLSPSAPKKLVVQQSINIGHLKDRIQECLKDKVVQKVIRLLQSGNKRNFKKAHTLWKARAPFTFADDPETLSSHAENFVFVAFDTIFKEGGNDRPTKWQVEQTLKEMKKTWTVFMRDILESLPDDMFADESCARCGVSEKDCEQELLSCSGCSLVLYCGPRCQKKHWKSTHKNDCANKRSTGN